MAAVNGVRRALSVIATDEQAAKAIRLIHGGLKPTAGMDAEAAAEAYLYALEGVKAAALDLAVRNILRRKAPERFSKVFTPAAPELREYCEEIERNELAKATLTERMLALPEEPEPEPEMTEEEMAARREQIAGLFTKALTHERAVERGLSPAARVAVETADRRKAGESQP